MKRITLFLFLLLPLVLGATARHVFEVRDDAYSESAWNGVASIAPSQNAVRDEIENRQLASSALDDLSALSPGTAGMDALEAVTAANLRSTAGITQGAWTPTFINVANAAGFVANECNYLRIGDVVVAWGDFQYDPIAASTGTQFRMSLPMAAESDFTSNGDASGAAGCTSDSTVERSLAAIADTANDEIQWRHQAFQTSQLTFSFVVVYLVR